MNLRIPGLDTCVIFQFIFWDDQLEGCAPVDFKLCAQFNRSGAKAEPAWFAKPASIPTLGWLSACERVVVNAAVENCSGKMPNVVFSCAGWIRWCLQRPRHRRRLGVKQFACWPARKRVIDLAGFPSLELHLLAQWHLIGMGIDIVFAVFAALLATWQPRSGQSVARGNSSGSLVPRDGAFCLLHNQISHMMMRLKASAMGGVQHRCHRAAQLTHAGHFLKEFRRQPSPQDHVKMKGPTAGGFGLPKIGPRCADHAH